MRGGAVGLLALAACGHPAPAPPEVPGPPLAVAPGDVHWYAVTGHDVRSLRESLRAVAPRNTAGEAMQPSSRVLVASTG